MQVTELIQGACTTEYGHIIVVQYTSNETSITWYGITVQIVHFVTHVE